MANTLKLSVAQLAVIQDRADTAKADEVTVEDTNLGGTLAVEIEGQRSFLVAPSGATYDI